MSETTELIAENYRLRDENKALRRLLDEQSVRLDRVEEMGVLVNGKPYPDHALMRVQARVEASALYRVDRTGLQKFICQSLAEALMENFNRIAMRAAPVNFDAGAAINFTILAIPVSK